MLGQTAHHGMSDRLMMNVIMDTNMGFAIRLLYSEISKHVRGKTRRERKSLYENFANFCVLSMVKNNR